MNQAIQQQTGSTPLNPTKRIEYIDALRGFTMILVVFQHVAAYCWMINGKGISIHDYLTQIRMPMFYFISGFVLFKATVVWDWKQVTAFFRKKIPVQLISPFIFFLLFIYTYKVPFMDALTDHHKCGYWFTFVLFEYYCFYAIVRFCIRNKWSRIILLLLGCLLYVVNSATIYDNIPLPEHIKGLLSISNWKYFLFFVLGTIVKEHFSQVEKILDNKWLLPLCITLFFLVNGFKDLIPVNDAVLNLILKFSGLVVLFSFFRINRHNLGKDRVVGRTLQYIGRRTLDIYLIHFFLIPWQLKYITVFSDHPMPIIEATVSLIIAGLIIAGSLLIGNIIRLSPFLAHWVFGAQYPPKEQ